MLYFVHPNSAFAINFNERDLGSLYNAKDVIELANVHCRFYRDEVDNLDDALTVLSQIHGGVAHFEDSNK